MAISPQGVIRSTLLHVWLYGGVFEVGGSNGAISCWIKFNKYEGENSVRRVNKLDWSSKVFLVTFCRRSGDGSRKKQMDLNFNININRIF